MTRLSGTVTGSKRLMKQLTSLPELTRRGLVEGLKISVIGIHADVVKSIQKQSPGKKAVRYEPKRNVTVSKPGAAPNTDTGKLIGGYEFEIDEVNLIGAVGSNDEIAPHLEFGTVNMEARPHLRPAVKRARRKIPKEFKTSVNTNLRKVRAK